MAFRTGSAIHVKLSELAVHYLTPPASSVDIERLFSTAADIVTNDRNRINPEKAEKILFCRENFSLIQYQYYFFLLHNHIVKKEKRNVIYVDNIFNDIIRKGVK